MAIVGQHREVHQRRQQRLNVIGFAAVSWFLRFLVRHSMYWFVGYRVVLGTVVLILLGTGVVAAT